MRIELKEIRIADLIAGYLDAGEEGVTGYSGRLNIRPKYQREFVYNAKQRDAVIRSVTSGFPLNTMYWGATQDGYELIDGQQRTLSLCKYVAGDFSVDGRAFHNLTEGERDAMLAYELIVYVCHGSEKERLDWFETINISGVALTKQELRNAVYAGPWLQDAKRYFSKTGCPAYAIASHYLKGSTIRQDYLETAIRWAADAEGITGITGGTAIELYMGAHQHDDCAIKLWQYFQTVIAWAAGMFNWDNGNPSILKSVDWGVLYNKYSKGDYNPKELLARVAELTLDDDVTSKSGIYEYLLGGDEHHLNIRRFSEAQRRTKYIEQGGICPMCHAESRDVKYDIGEMDADHITPWRLGGKTVIENCQMLCKTHNRRKGMM